MRRLALLAAALVAATALPAASAPTRLNWTVNGPDGGAAGSLEIDLRNPSTIYAGTSAGVFRSTNGGRTWHRRSTGLPTNAAIGLLEIAPSDPSRLYARLETGFFTTADAGATWSRLPNLEHWFSYLVVDPSQPRTLYGTSFLGLIKSIDGGQTWSRLPLAAHSALAIAPSAPNVLYAELSNRLMRSADRGVTWTETTGSYSGLRHITVDPRDPDTIYFTVGDDLYKSTNGGSNAWQIREGTTPAPDIHTVAIDPRVPSTIYAGTSNRGVFRSRDGGATWSHMAAGLPTLVYPGRPVGESIVDLEVSPALGSPVYATTSRRGVYRSERGENRWREANNGLVATRIWEVALDPRSPSVVYAGTQNGGLWRSRDGGRHWVRRGLTGRIVSGIAVDPVKGRIVWAAAGTGLYRSGNRGRTWKRRLRLPDLTSVSVVAIAPSNRRFVYAGTRGRGLYRSWNSGRTWHPPELRAVDDVSSIAVHPRRPRTLWVGVGGLVLHSSDGGVTFLERAKGLPTHVEVNAIVVNPRNPRVLYAAVEYSGVYRSVNAGASWTRMNEGASSSAEGLAIDRRRPNVLYVGGWDRAGGGGVFRSLNGARTWASISAGMTTDYSSVIALSPNGRRLYVGTAWGDGGGGVFAANVR